MCEHAVSHHLKRSFQDHLERAVLSDSVRISYDVHASAIYGVLLRVVECELCAGDILVHTFIKTCSKDQAPPELYHLLQAALRCSCEGVEEKTRQGMRGRIRAWYNSGRADDQSAQQRLKTVITPSAPETLLAEQPS